MSTIEKKIPLKQRLLAFFASTAVLAGGVVAGVHADTPGTNDFVRINKVDESGQHLAGATFHIEDGAGNRVPATFFDANGSQIGQDSFVSANGTVTAKTASPMAAGTYYLVEDNAPAGYAKQGDGRTSFTVTEATKTTTSSTTVNPNLTPGGQTQVIGYTASGSQIARGASTMATSDGKSLVFCVNPQVTSAYDDPGKPLTYTVLSESQVDLNAFGEKVKEGNGGWVNRDIMSNNVNLTPAKMEQIKRVLWATYDYMMTNDISNDPSGILKAYNFDKVPYGAGGVYFAVDMAIADIVAPGSVNWGALSDNTSTGPSVTFGKALVAASASSTGYFASYSGYSLYYLYTENTGDQNLITVGEEEKREVPEVTVVNKKTPTGEITIEKYDNSGNLLAGAHLQIINSEGVVVEDFVSNGTSQKFRLPVGDYKLHEVSAPAGYDLAVDVPFTIIDDSVKTETVKETKAPAELPAPTATTDGQRFSDGSGRSTVGYCINDIWYKDWDYGVPYTAYELTDDNLNHFANKNYGAGAAQKALRVLFAGDEGNFYASKFPELSRVDRWRATQYVITYYLTNHYHANVDIWGDYNWDGYKKKQSQAGNAKMDEYTNALIAAWDDASLDAEIAKVGWNGKIYSSGHQPAIAASFGSENETVKEWQDKNGTVTMIDRKSVEIGTQATDAATGLKIANAGDPAQGPVDVTIKDVVSYKNLWVDQDYVLKGQLVLKSTGQVLDTSYATFTAKQADGEAVVNFSFKADGDLQKKLASGDATVAFEELYTAGPSVHKGEGDSATLMTGEELEATGDADKRATEGDKIAEHKDINDAGQTVTFPGAKTNATDKADGNHYVEAGKVTIVDRVTYTGLISGKEYTVSGTLHDKETGKALTVDGATATKTFTATQANGYVDLEFTIDASALTGKAIVAFEEVKYDGKLVAVHADINDEDQTVYVQQIKTTATADGKKIVNADGTVTIKDVVEYKGLKANTKYTLQGKLVTKSSKGAKSVAEASREFTTTASGNGTVELEFTISDASVLKGDSVVAFEKVLENGEVVATHEDLGDADQTVTFPEIKTNAHAKDNADENVIKPAKKTTVVDTVTYTNLIVGKEYTVSGTLMKKSDGNLLVVNGKEVTASKTFKAEKANGTIDLEFTFDASALEGETLVAFEKLFTEGDVVATHEDINDEDQTVTITKKPQIGTTATDGADGDKEIEAAADQKIVDTVTYSGLDTKKTYTLRGTLMNKATHEPVVINGEQVTAAKEFKPSAPNGEITLTFTLDDARELAGADLVVFEKLYIVENGQRGEEVANHEDYNDAGQTVHVPEEVEIGTTATDAGTQDHVVSAGGEVTINDVVEYKNLKPGQTYTLKGDLWGTKFTENGDGTAKSWLRVVTSNIITFVPETANGKVTVPFTINANELAGVKLVAAEYLYKGDVTSVTNEDELKEAFIADHYDLDDEGQTVYVPEVKTNASDKADGDKIVDFAKDVTVVDVVSFDNLIPGKEYSLDGTLHIKDEKQTPVAAKSIKAVAATGATIKDADARTFVANAAKGTVTLEFTVDASKLAGKEMVVFETLKYKGVDIAVHADINDEDQTVKVKPKKPEIGTTATNGATGGKTIASTNTNAVVKDVVKYYELDGGEVYTLKAKLVKKSDGKVVATSEAKFTADESGNGSVDVFFKLDASKLNGQSLVAFEYLYKGDYEGKDVNEESKDFVTKHEDRNDVDQTVDVEERTPHIGTTASDKADGDKIIAANGKAEIVDVIAYEGLVEGKTYTLKGVLMATATHKSDDGRMSNTYLRPAATAEATFKAEAGGTGLTTMVFTVDDVTEYPGAKFVAYEYLFEGTYTGDITGPGDVNRDLEEFVADHEDLNDEGQTVYVPEVKTNASVEGSGELPEGDYDAKIQDRVTFSNLVPGKEYSLDGTLHYKDAKETTIDDVKSVVIVDYDKDAVELVDAEARTFVAKKAGGFVTLEFTVPASKLSGKTVVVFESLKHNGKEIAAHADINDENQTIKPKKPEIGTTATDSDTEDHIAHADGTVTIKDVVRYEGLVPGTDYTLKGKLVKADASSVEKAEVVAEAEAHVTANSLGRGTWTVDFTFDGSQLAGTRVVALEYLYDVDGTTEIAKHEDLTDEGQSVDFPEVKTNASDKADGDQEIPAGKDVVVVDVVTFNNLIPGKKYTIDGTLHIKDKKQTPVEAKSVKAVQEGSEGVADVNADERSFTATAKSGKIVLEFTVDASKLAGEKVVVFESLKYNGKEIAAHADINDEAQTVSVPQIGTTATDSETQDHIANADDTVTIKDVVKYENLISGKDYLLKGKLVTKSSDGKTVVAEAENTVTAEASEGEWEIEFSFKASDLAGDRVVAFEYLYDTKGEVLITKHEDINDEGQSVDFPEVKTNASDKLDGDKFVKPAADVTVVDVVTFNNLIPGKEYSLNGTLHKKDADGNDAGVVPAKSVKAVSAEGAEIKDADARTFVAKAAKGSVTLEFTVDGSKLAGEKVVVFETLKYKGVDVAVHADINDEDQTVTFPEIGTTATVNGSHEAQTGGVVTLTDTVKYEGLIPGEPYTLVGTLMDKKSGKAVPAKVAKVVTKTFTPEAADGEEQVDFEVNIDELRAWTEATGDVAVVVFEKLYRGDVEEGEEPIATHEDLEDEGQTVTFKPVAYGSKKFHVNKVEPREVTDESQDPYAPLAGAKLEVRVGSPTGEVLDVKPTEECNAHAERYAWVSDGKAHEIEVCQPTGVYYVVETEAPKGYQLADPIKVELTAYGEILVNGEALEGTDVVNVVNVREGQTPPPTPTPTPTVTTSPTPPTRPVPPTVVPPSRTIPLPVTGLPSTGSAIGFASALASLLVGAGIMMVRRREEA